MNVKDMNNIRGNSVFQKKTKQLTLFVLFLILLNISIVFNIYILRQILGFIFLSFIPGFFLIFIIKLNKLRLAEIIVLSIGLSISFDMLLGFLVNTLYPLFGYNTPLSPKSIIITFSLAILFLAYLFFAYFDLPSLKLRICTSDMIFLFFPIFFLPMSILGMHLMNNINNNNIIMILLFLIPGYLIIILLFNNYISENLYAFFLLSISISLILLLGLRSNHLIGADIHVEYYIFRQTLFYENWQPFFKTILNSCLSISILPAIFQIFLNIDPEYFFKVFYSIIASFSPLIVYNIARIYLSSPYAFLASFFYISQMGFLNTASNPRTSLGIFFFAISLEVLLDTRISSLAKKLLIIIFISSCIVSHYGSAYIYFFILLFAYLAMQFSNRIYSCITRNNCINPFHNSKATGDTYIDNISAIFKPDLALTLGILAIFFVMIFVWYGQITNETFSKGIGFIISSINSLQDLFILESRRESVTSAFGSGFDDFGLVKKMSFVLNWLNILFIAIGVLFILYRYIHCMIDNSSTPYCVKFLDQKVDPLFLYLGVACSSLVSVSILFPYISNGYSIDRIYTLTLVVLSSFFIFGGIIIARSIFIKQEYVIILIIIILLNLCITGALSQLFGSNQSIILNSEGDLFEKYYVYDHETMSAKWLKDFMNQNSKLFSDNLGERRLLSQGLLNTTSVYDDSIIELIERNKSLNDGYIFLRYVNVINGKIYSKYPPQWHNMSEYKSVFKSRNVLYHNGGSIIC